MEERKVRISLSLRMRPYTLGSRDKDKYILCLAKRKTKILSPLGARVPTTSVKLSSSSIWITTVVYDSWPEGYLLETRPGDLVMPDPFG